MIINNTEAQPKLEKMARNPSTLQFGLSPEGFLLINSGNVVDVCDFRLFHSGKYYRRNGFQFSTNMQIPKSGLFLCSLGNGKFVAQCAEDQFEYASKKKPVSDEFCMVILMRSAERIILLIADGNFANEACLVVLADSPGNETFAKAIVHKLVGARDADAAYMLRVEPEEAANVEEK